jgi:hypothetical protein
MKALALIAYSPSHWEMFWRAAVFVDKGLKGTTPVDLPMERPLKTIDAVDTRQYVPGPNSFA